MTDIETPSPLPPAQLHASVGLLVAEAIEMRRQLMIGGFTADQAHHITADWVHARLYPNQT